MDDHHELVYEGDVLTDITSFSLVQNIFSGSHEVNQLQIETLDTIVQLLVFYDNVWVIEPFTYGAKIEVKSQDILEQLIHEGVVRQFTQISCSNEIDFLAQFKEIEELIYPQSFEEYANTHKELVSNLEIYERNYGFSTQKGAQELANRVNLDYRFIPLVTNMLRANFYFKYLQELKEKEKKSVVYSPNVIRAPLTDEIINRQQRRLEHSINKILHDQIKNIESIKKREMEAINKDLYTSFRMDLPLLTSIILKQCKNRDDFFEEVIKLKRDKSARKLRQWLKKLQNALFTEDFQLLTEYERQIHLTRT